MAVTMKLRLPMFVVAMLLLTTPSIAQDYEKGLKAAKRCDFEAAILEWLPFAEQGDVEAQKYLGALYLNSFCTTMYGWDNGYRPAEAVKWLRRAAEAGDADAQSNFGELYRRGDHVPQDFTMALKWFRLAAAQGDTGAQGGLGLMYNLGMGVPHNDAEAAKWHRLVAEKGDEYSQFELAHFYLAGAGVPQDFVEAAKWFRLSAEQGHGGAMSELGMLYVEGRGVPRDLVQAYKWIILAAAQAVRLRAEFLDPILAQMTQAEIWKAKRLAHDWLGAHPELAREWADAYPAEQEVP